MKKFKRILGYAWLAMFFLAIAGIFVAMLVVAPWPAKIFLILLLGLPLVPWLLIGD